MKYTYSLFPLLISTFLLSSCGGGGSTSVSTSETNNQAPETIKIAGKLKRSSESSLTDYFRQISQQQITPDLQQPTVVITAQADVSATSSSRSDTNLSVTNVQENGVDEADLLKTSSNGRYIYGVDKSGPRSAPGPILENSLNKTYVKSESDSIRIMDAQNTQLIEVKRLVTTDKTWNINGLYLDDTGDKLIALSANNTDYHLNWFNSHYFSQQTTELLFFNIETPSIATLNHTLSFDGTVIDSRRNGDVLYLVLRHFPEHIYDKDSSQAPITTNDILPSYQLNREEKQSVVIAENCYQEEEGKNNANIITLIAVNLATNTPEINSQCYIGAAEAIYASQQALYLATTKSSYQVNNGIADYSNMVSTDIHKFAYNGMAFDYRGSAEVRGHLGYQQNRKSFRFSEYKDELRVVTFSPSQWDNIPPSSSTTAITPSPVSLTILTEDDNEQALRTIAQLPNTNRPTPIGLAGEKLYASRFIGNKAYFVTFRVTDPLYVVDLSNSEDPFIAGELKLDGYSDYLQPISDTLLLGIGKDAVAATNEGDGRDAWHQGIKLSLLDISDPANPREADKMVIGKRGTESNALYNHHALTRLQVGDNIQRIALPIRFHEEESSNNITEPHPSQYYGHSNTGLYRFEIDINNQKITQLPALIISEDPATSDSFVIENDRSVIINDDVHYLYNGEFQSRTW